MSEVDPETRIVDIIDYVAVDDVGTLINPRLAAGQIHGGVAQGIAQALYEEVSYDPENGQLLTGSLLDYALPRAEHVPNITSLFQETPSPTNPNGVKDVGESGPIAAPPCMFHTRSSTRSPHRTTHLDMPMAPPRIWAAVQAARDGGPAMIPAAFDYVCATSLDQAIDLLNHDPEGSKLLVSHADPHAEVAAGIPFAIDRHPRDY